MHTVLFCFVVVVLQFRGDSYLPHIVYPIKYTYGFVVFCFGMLILQFMGDTCVLSDHIIHGYFTGTGAII